VRLDVEAAGGEVAAREQKWWKRKEELGVAEGMDDSSHSMVVCDSWSCKTGIGSIAVD
jgi:hypothetical protein